jgi:hypothetical protein
MSRYSKKTSSNSGHPYWNLTNWKNGTLQYWNNGESAYLYSPETKAKLDARLADMINGTKNLASFDSGLK